MTIQTTIIPLVSIVSPSFLFFWVEFIIFFVLLFWFLGNRIAGLSRKLPLPPGSMGWPYVGETFRLYSQDPNVFFASKQKKYGNIFKTHILGCPCIMVSSPKAAKFILVTGVHLFKPTFPVSKERLLGREALFFQQGDCHYKLRKLVLRAVTPEVVKNIVPEIELIAINVLRSLEGKMINTYQEMKTYTFNVAMHSILGKEEIRYREELKESYYILEKGYNSMPFNIPGTSFYRAMKSRKHLSQILSKILSERRKKGETRNDLLGSFMEEKEALTDEQITDNVIGVLFAARDTTASVLTWILKYLGENSRILQAEEQEEIQRYKQEIGNGENLLTWADMKKMTFTSRVLQETLRIASILSFTFREAVQDVEYQGYLIPKGWKVLPLFRNIHHSADIFPEPNKFDPSRFEVAPNPTAFMPFGNGIHSCPGNNLAKVEILVFLHHLTTKYRWSVFGSQNGIMYGPFALPQNGLTIKLIALKNCKLGVPSTI